MCHWKWILSAICFLVVSSVQSWSMFPIFTNTSFEKYTNEKITSLKNLRGILHGSHKSGKPITSETPETPEKVVFIDTNKNVTSKECNDGTSNRNFDCDESIASNSSIITPQESRDGLFNKFLPKRDIIKSIADIRERLEPEVKRYLTDKYNLFLNNLVPYSETIGVPPYVLNSLKIPQNFDPRWQVIKSLMESSIETRNLNGSRNSWGSSDKSSLNDIQGRSDDQELVSDQEPDATIQGQKKYQHVYISPRNRANKSPFLQPDPKKGFDFADSIDSGSQRHEVYDAYSRDYYLDETPYGLHYDDMQVAAGSHIARGSHGHHGGGGGYNHGGGGGGGHGGGYGGMTDPFTILGSLAFLTYLGLLIQQSLNRTGTAGRGFSGGYEWDTLTDTRKIPLALTQLKFNLQHDLDENASGSEASVARDIPVKSTQNENPGRLRVDEATVMKSTSTECNALCQILKRRNIRLFRKNSSE